MNEEIYQNYKLAGKIAADAREYGKKLIKPNVALLDIAEKVETKITEQGAGIAFPVNLSINEIAAHFSPRHDDTLVFHEGDVVKLDVGAHIDGYIADTSSTVEVKTHNYEKMITASKEALESAINLIKADVDLTVVGETIEDKINSFGFKSIDNLTGHGLRKYVLHSGVSVPNVGGGFSRVKPKVDDVLAIEPFATNGSGHVISGQGSNIYLYNEGIGTRLIRDQKTRIMLIKMKKRFNGLPFAQRWCAKSIPNCDRVLQRLSLLQPLKHYPQLIDSGKGIVTQAEHTVIVGEDGCEVTT